MDESVSPGKILREKIRKNEERLNRDYEIHNGQWAIRGIRMVKRGGVFRDLIIRPKLDKTAEELQSYSLDDYNLYID